MIFLSNVGICYIQYLHDTAGIFFNHQCFVCAIFHLYRIQRTYTVQSNSSSISRIRNRGKHPRNGWNATGRLQTEFNTIQTGCMSVICPLYTDAGCWSNWTGADFSFAFQFPSLRCFEFTSTHFANNSGAERRGTTMARYFNAEPVII